MTTLKNWSDSVKDGRVWLIAAVVLVIAGLLLIYLANNILSVNVTGQALVAYIGVFVIVAGILLLVNTLLSRGKT